MNPLQEATIDELVAEILSRQTFRGIILRQEGSFKGVSQPEWRWDCGKGTTAAWVIDVLAEIIPQIQRHAEGSA